MNEEKLKEYEDLYGKDELGHIWAESWIDSNKPHPGFGTYGAYCGQCAKCGMYDFECYGGTLNSKKCETKIREF